MITEQQVREYFREKGQIAIIWSIEDVMDDTVRPDLNESEAMQVLQHVERYHSADMGVNWDTIRQSAEEMFPTSNLLKEKINATE